MRSKLDVANIVYTGGEGGNKVRKILRSILIVTIILGLLISGISCSKSSTETLTTPPVEEKSDTEQIIDRVIASIVAIEEGEESSFKYWYEDFEPFTESTGKKSMVQILSYNCYERDGQITYAFPKIQENLAVFDVVLHYNKSYSSNLGTDIEKSIFRFNLKKYSQTGWRITDIRLIYTENTMAQDMLSRLSR